MTEPQARIRALVDEAQEALARARGSLAAGQRLGAGATRVDAATRELAEAEARLRLVLLDGSMGFHNVEKAERLLRESEALAQDVGQRIFGTP